MAGYEYARLSATTVSVDLLVTKMNDLAAEGWELVSTHSADKTIGFNAVTALIRRELVPLSPPPEEAPGWYVDPSGRWEGRYWNGRAWTFAVHRSGEEKAHRDPPTALPPTAGIVQ